MTHSQQGTLMVIVIGGLLVAFVIYAAFALREGAARQRLLNTGERVDAVIVELRGTNSFSSLGRYWDAQLEIRSQGETPYRVRAEFFVANLDVPQYQAGATIHAYRDPRDPSRIAVEDSVHYKAGTRRTAP